MLTMILFAVPEDVARDCEGIAAELRIGRAEVRHLQAACAALRANPGAILVASVAIRPWDRQVVEEHAARSGTTILWVGGASLDDVGPQVRRWAMETTRRARTGR
jgi:hypothetical protein